METAKTCQVLKTWQVSVVDSSQEICSIFATTLKIDMPEEKYYEIRSVRDGHSAFVE
jgi:hypothetical protein